MLPGLGFSEILVLAVIALLVIGPKDLPNFLRMLGRWTRRMQALAAEFRQGFDDLARQAELDELRREVDALRRTADPTAEFREHAEDLHREMTAPIEGAAPESAPDSAPEAPPAEHSDAAEIAAPKPAPGAVEAQG